MKAWTGALVAMNNTEIMLKTAFNTIQSINQLTQHGPS